MSRVVSARVSDELAEWVDGYAGRREVKKGAIVEAAIKSYRADCEGGVPDLPPVREAPRDARPRRYASTAENMARRDELLALGKERAAARRAREGR